LKNSVKITIFINVNFYYLFILDKIYYHQKVQLEEEIPMLLADNFNLQIPSKKFKVLNDKQTF
jgi:hypothetical protein